jgi:hypothetical protein
MMRATIRMVCMVAAVCAVALSCSKAIEAPPLKELQRAKSGDLDVVLLASADSLKPGKDQAFLEFRKGSTGLVDVGTVTVNATMPMAGMPPMMGSSFVKKTDTPGRYAIDTDLSMAGSWRLEIIWNGPAGSGKVTLPGTVR